MAANEVIYYDDAETGAPVLNNVNGSWLAVIQACLVDGFNSKSVTSIVVASNVATLTCTAHGYAFDRMLNVAGVTGGPTGFANINGRKRILSVTANTLTFATSGVADGTATGTITSIRAPLGWTRLFTGTNKAVYKSGDVAASGLVLRVDDIGSGNSTATDVRLVMYESMTDVDTGLNPTPTVAQVAAGMFGNKGTNNTTAKKWTLIGDGRYFYFLTQGGGDTTASQMMVFGDINSYRASDPWSCMLSASLTAYAAGNYNSPIWGYSANIGLQPQAASASSQIARSFNGVGSGVIIGIAAGLFGPSTNVRIPAAANGYYPLFPSPVDNGFVIQKPVLISENNATFGYPIRGEAPGLGFPYCGPFNNPGDLITNVVNSTSTFLVIGPRLYDSSLGSFVCRMLIDVTGPWR